MHNITIANKSNLIDRNALLSENNHSLKAPRVLMEMYQKMSFNSFKLWLCLLIEISDKQYTKEKVDMPLSVIWNSIGHRLSHEKLLDRVRELQRTIIEKNEYLVNSSQYETTTFQALGEAVIRSDEFGSVNFLNYHMMDSLLKILKNEENQEEFIIEMKMISSLKGDRAGENAKNIILLCMPHVNNGQTPYLSFDDIKAYCNIKDSYIDKESGEHNVKTIMKTLIGNSISTINNNPYVEFSINEVIKVKNNPLTPNKTTGVIFKLEKKESLKLTGLATPNAPIEPDKLIVTLRNYWNELSQNPQLSYDEQTLKKILKQLQLVDKYIFLAIEKSDFNHDQVAGTKRLIGMVTAVYQLWLKGHFKSESSKIYSYTISIINNPNMDMLTSLVHEFLNNEKIGHNNNQNENTKNKAYILEHAKSLNKIIRDFNKNRIEHVLMYYGENELIKEKDRLFFDSYQRNNANIWVKKALEQIDKNAIESKGLVELLTRNTLSYYKTWLCNQAEKEDLLTEKTIDKLCEKYPSALQHITVIGGQQQGHFYMLENHVADIIKQYK